GAVDLAFLGDAPRSGAFFLAFLLISLVFLAVGVFLRVDALTAAFLRFASVLAVAFFALPLQPAQASSCILVVESLPITKQVNGQGGAGYYSHMLRGFRALMGEMA
ncbi:MAG TPA: hypothetical protein VKP52_01120, partial [Pseudolabrys sp.]|nr:hypothetical protein [Pseudolabrys sp.]